MKTPLRILEYNGVKFCDGLFRMHDERGFSLTDSLIQCKERGLTPCISQFRSDAKSAGWTDDKIERTILEAQRDSVLC